MRQLGNRAAYLGGVLAFNNAVHLAEAKADLAARTRKTPYICPIPDDVKPPLDMSLA